LINKNYLDFLEEINMLQEFGPLKETPACTYTTALFEGQVNLLGIRTTTSSCHKMINHRIVGFRNISSFLCPAAKFG
jgi:hypothetical protein